VTKGKKRVRAANIRGQTWKADEWVKSMRTFMGSIPYMAPEMMTQTYDLQTRYGPRIDVYSLGIVIYEMLTESKPWKKEIEKHGIESVIKAVKRGTRPSIRPEIFMNAPHELGNIMNECWRQHGVNRPSAQRVVDTLNPLMLIIQEDESGVLAAPKFVAVVH
jgi:serine/threonine protein kinase